MRRSSATSWRRWSRSWSGLSTGSPRSESSDGIPSMPKGTKAQRAGKVAGRRLVYVSWLETNASKLAWKNTFFERVQSETWALEDSFEPPLQTGDERAGTVKNEWRRVLIGGKGSGGRGAHITDIVSVVTNAYIKENTS